jgi:hypothetical protein
MKIVINKDFGGYGLNEKWEKIAETLNVSEDDEQMRTHPDLIQEIETGEYENDNYAELGVVEIPDDSTDYEINEYDGFESVIYVLDGKIHWAH